MKYCEGLDCEICNEKEPCIYRRANKLQQCLDEIERILLSNYITSYDIGTMLEKIKEVKGNDD